MRKTAAGTDAEDYVRGVLELSKRLRVLCIVSLGYPAEKRKPVAAGRLRSDSVEHR